MDEVRVVMPDPRWGQLCRDRKAEAILSTLRPHCGSDLPTGTWLDIGCGSGGISATLSNQVEHVIGVDPEPWQRWDEFRRQHANLEFHVGTYRELRASLGGRSCSVVICNQVYEHVDDPAALLRAIHTVMKPGAVCYFAGPNLLWPIEPHVFWPFVHWLPRIFAQRCMRMLGSKKSRDLDAWSWSYWKLTRVFREEGFVYSSAIRDRLRAEAGARRSALTRILAHMPKMIFSVLAPFSPAFVFILRKREDMGT